MKKMVLGLLLAAFAFGLQARELKLAVVDMEKIFREYYKSKVAEEAIKAQAEIYRNYVVKLNTEATKLTEQYKVALDGSQNIALSENERKKHAAETERLEREIKMKVAEREDYATGKNRQMQELELKKRNEVVEDIRNEVKRRSAAEGYDLVLDISGKTLNDIATVVHYNANMDITKEIITELNRSNKTIDNDKEKKQ